MAPRVHHHRRREPRERVSRARKGYFYPGEAARILGLDGVDYHQLRQLLIIASGVRPPVGESRKWARFSFRDLVAVRKAIEVAGGIAALRDGRHLRLKRLRKVCLALQKSIGVRDPLSSVRVEVQDDTVVAQLDGVAFEPVSGQLLLDLRRSIREEVINPTTALVRRLSAEQNQLRRPPRMKDKVQKTSVLVTGIRRRPRE